MPQHTTPQPPAPQRPSAQRPAPRRAVGKRRKKRRMSRKKRIVLVVIITILGIVATALIMGALYILHLLGLVNIVGLDDSKQYATSLEVDPLDPDYSGVIVDDPVEINNQVNSVDEIEVKGNTKVVTNILLLGVETEDKDNYIGRSDTNIILSINTYKKTITLISLMRDTYVAIPGYGYNKLNAAYSLHGFSLLSSTIEKNYRLDIDQYMAVNFDAFSKVVDAMNGIDMELSDGEAENLQIGSTAGIYHLNGETALNYSRIRYVEALDGKHDDWGRNERQRAVLKALMTNAKSMDLGTLQNVMEAMFPEIETNMSQTDLLSYILHAAAYLKYDIVEYYLPQQDGYTDPYVPAIQQQVIVIKDPKAAVLELQHLIYG